MIGLSMLCGLSLYATSTPSTSMPSLGKRISVVVGCRLPKYDTLKYTLLDAKLMAERLGTDEARHAAERHARRIERAVVMQGGQVLIADAEQTVAAFERRSAGRTTPSGSTGRGMATSCGTPAT